jgi:hypothetical protein
MLNNKLKLRAKLESKRIVRGGLDKAYEILEQWSVLRERLLSENRNITLIDYRLCQLENEIEDLEQKQDCTYTRVDDEDDYSSTESV